MKQKRKYTDGITPTNFAINDSEGMHRFICAIDAVECICQKHNTSILNLSDEQYQEVREMYNENLTKQK